MTVGFFFFNFFFTTFKSYSRNFDSYSSDLEVLGVIFIILMVLLLFFLVVVVVGHFGGFRSILVILKDLELFWSFERV